MCEGDQNTHVVVIGAGPAGLAAAYELTRLGAKTSVLEKNRQVGGIARTELHNGFRFDLGGHRFFTRSPEIDALWRELLGAEFLRRPRRSRIFYRSRFFLYPVRLSDALLKLGAWQSLLIVLSYLRWVIAPYPREDTFEEWVTNRFGRRLFQIFFKTYTEKVWGIPCSELRAEWAAQRIRGLSLIRAALGGLFRSGRQIRTLIEEFDYPRLGPGQMWSRLEQRVAEQGGAVRLNADVTRVQRNGPRVDSVLIEFSDGSQNVVPAQHFISSMPIAELIDKLDPPAPPEIRASAARLKHRDFLTVSLVVNQAALFADNWIYVHDPSVRVGRIQNFKNWSPDMVPDPNKTTLGMEYFCSEGDDLWVKADADLVELARQELSRIGLAHYGDIEDGFVFRVPRSYPVYDADYRQHLQVVRSYLETFDNLQTIGRNGLHRYNNMDHAMLTGILAARNLLLEETNDLWAINADEGYLEDAPPLTVTPSAGSCPRSLSWLPPVALRVLGM